MSKICANSTISLTNFLRLCIILLDNTARSAQQGGREKKNQKHLIYFENLLQEANNDLVKQAKSDGKLALGYTCYFMPEVLLDLPGCFSVRLRAPRSTSPDMAT